MFIGIDSRQFEITSPGFEQDIKVDIFESQFRAIVKAPRITKCFSDMNDVARFVVDKCREAEAVRSRFKEASALSI